MAKLVFDKKQKNSNIVFIHPTIVKTYKKYLLFSISLNICFISYLLYKFII